MGINFELGENANTPDKGFNHRQEDILNNISSLQELESNLVAWVKEHSSDDATEFEKHKKTLERINEISNARVGLYDTLNNMYEYQQTNVAGTRSDLVNQLTVINMMENELNNIKKQMKGTLDDKNNKLRLVEINTYYGKRYKAHSEFMKLLIMICIPILIISVLSKRGYMNDNMANYGIAFILAVGMLFVFKRLWNIGRRDNMSFDEYTWFFDPNSNPTVWDYNMKHLGLNKGFVEEKKQQAMQELQSLGYCANGSCCGEGLVFDNDELECVIPKEKKGESFSNQYASV
jgi:hypothetical protein